MLTGERQIEQPFPIAVTASSHGEPARVSADMQQAYLAAGVCGILLRRGRRRVLCVVEMVLVVAGMNTNPGGVPS